MLKNSYKKTVTCTKLFCILMYFHSEMAFPETSIQNAARTSDIIIYNGI